MYSLFFTGRDSVRDCIIIGEDNKPIYFELITQYHPTTGFRTLFNRDARDIAAELSWSGNNGTQLGTASTPGGQCHMSSLARTMAPGVRVFSMGGHQYEWRRRPDGNYDLYASYNNARMASFRRHSQQTPLGQSHAFFQYYFIGDQLLILSLISLTINRWIDSQGWAM